MPMPKSKPSPFPTLASKLPLTESDTRDLRARTFPGQADWGGGPRTCRECEHWLNDGGRRMRTTGELKKARCNKATVLSGAEMAEVPHYAGSCKYFSENSSPPPVFPLNKRK